MGLTNFFCPLDLIGYLQSIFDYKGMGMRRYDRYTRPMFSRRDFLKAAGLTGAALGGVPLMSSLLTSVQAAEPDAPGLDANGALRCINVVNFIREIEPRFPMDMMLPVRKQMELILAHDLPATWLLQFDALVSGPFAEYLRRNMAENHEVGFWFEMNQRHCQAAGVEWRGRPGYEWDHTPSVAFTIGYTEAERVKLADAAMREFKVVWGKTPASIASWNLDSFTIAHLSQNYGIDAYAVCRDQIATDGFTIWGAPIAGYYPSRNNCWSPAVERENQISTPIFRMLGQDPVYYYDKEWTLPSGQRLSEPDTLEPVWTSGRSPVWVDGFLQMIAQAPTLRFAYAQAGQENTFPWPQQAAGYPMQMEALAKLRAAGKVHVETMGDSGRRFKRAFEVTPAQAQVQLADPFGNSDPAQRSVWYQSRFYRANLHFKGDLPYLRDIMVYSDANEQPFLQTATRQSDVEQRLPAIIDGYHWRRDAGANEPGAGGFFNIGGARLRATGAPVVSEAGSTLSVALPVGEGRTLTIRFEENQMACSLTPQGAAPLTLAFEWDAAKAALTGVEPKRVNYRWQDFDYGVNIEAGRAAATAGGWTVVADGGALVLGLAQNQV